MRSEGGKILLFTSGDRLSPISPTWCRILSEENCLRYVYKYTDCMEEKRKKKYTAATATFSFDSRAYQLKVGKYSSALQEPTAGICIKRGRMRVDVYRD